jgi:hypothetical protein
MDDSTVSPLSSGTVAYIFYVVYYIYYYSGRPQGAYLSEVNHCFLLCSLFPFESRDLVNYFLAIIISLIFSA